MIGVVHGSEGNGLVWIGVELNGSWYEGVRSGVEWSRPVRIGTVHGLDCTGRDWIGKERRGSWVG